SLLRDGMLAGRTDRADVRELDPASGRDLEAAVAGEFLRVVDRDLPSAVALELRELVHRPAELLGLQERRPRVLHVDRMGPGELLEPVPLEPEAVHLASETAEAPSHGPGSLQTLASPCN